MICYGHHTSKKGNLQLCQNYRTVSLISHTSKVMLKSPLTGSSHKRRTSSLKNRPAFEQDTVLHSEFSTLESYAKSTCNTKKTMSLLTSRRHLTGYGMQPYGGIEIKKFNPLARGTSSLNIFLIPMENH